MVWDNRMLNIAKEVSMWSKDPNKKIGAVIVNSERRIISQGYNGLPKGMNDELNNTVLKNVFVCHAEVNAIINAKGNCKDTTIYVHGLPTCIECAKIIAQAEIKKVVVQYNFEKFSKSKWADSVLYAKSLFKALDIEYIENNIE